MSAREPERPGYKQTEVGVIPKDWVTSELSAVATMKSGVGITSTYIDQTSEHPCYGGNGIRGFTAHFTHDGSYALIGRQGALCGNVSRVDGKFFASEHAIVVTAADRTDIDWLALVLGDMRLNRFSESSAQPGLSVTKVLSLRVVLPPTKAEQSAISAALSDVGALIASLDALIAKKRDIKQAAMQQLLTGKTRLPGFSGEWEVKRLGEYGDFKGGNGFALKYQGNATGEFPFFKVSDMNNEGNSMSMSNSNHWVSEEVRGLLGARPFPRNSIVFAKIGAAIFLERKKMLVRPSCIDNNMMAFVFTRTDVDPGFFHYRFLTIELGKLVSATALPSLNGRDIAALKFGFPPPAEQAAIAAVLSDIDAEITALEAKRDKTRALKAGMMQELLTGRIRLI